MSRHFATALTVMVAATGVLTVAASGGAAPGQLPPSNLTPPTISGTTQVGTSLTANTGTWDGKRLQFAFQWLRCDSSGAGCSAIGGATASTFSLLSTYLGARMRVVVIATNRNGSVVATSEATAAVTSTPSAPQPPPPPPPSFYLSDLSWASMTNARGPVERDLSNGEQGAGDGHTITLNGQTYAKGLGTHANSEVRYGISGCTRFQASAGVDDEVGANGSVLFQGYLDGVKAYDSGLVTGASATKDIDLDTTGKSELRLVVSNGGDDGSYDHADWANARVTCASIPSPPPAAPAPTSPSVTSAPATSGATQQGQTLTVSTGTWNGTTPMTYSYQWHRCNSTGASCTPVAGATGTSYLLASADVGSTMRGSVTASNSAGSATASSAATAVVSTSPTLPAGTVLFKKQWEDGLKESEGWGSQDSSNVADTTSIHRGTIAPDSSTSDTGTTSGRFVLPAYTGGRTAAEMLHSRISGNHVHDWYAMSIRFGDYNWGSLGGQDLSLGQFNYANINGSPGHLSAYGSSASNAGVYYLVNAGGPAPTGTPTPYYSGTPVGGGFASRGMPVPGPYYVLRPGTVQLNTWYEIIIHTYWTTDLDGIVEAWFRVKGSSVWSRAFSYSGGFPTLQWGANESGYNVTPSNIATIGTNDKFGAYRGASAGTTSVYHDSFCRATNFDAAAGCFR